MIWGRRTDAWLLAMKSALSRYGRAFCVGLTGLVLLTRRHEVIDQRVADVLAVGLGEAEQLALGTDALALVAAQVAGDGAGQGTTLFGFEFSQQWGGPGFQRLQVVSHAGPPIRWLGSTLGH